MSAESYRELVELAQREFELVRRQAYDDLPSVWSERDALIAQLPEAAPAEARAALERAAQVQTSTTELLQERSSATGAELRHLSQGRTAMRGYTPPMRRVPLVDRAG
jgi:hypothetical protein